MYFLTKNFAAGKITKNIKKYVCRKISVVVYINFISIYLYRPMDIVYIIIPGYILYYILYYIIYYIIYIIYITLFIYIPFA